MFFNCQFQLSIFQLSWILRKIVWEILSVQTLSTKPDYNGVNTIKFLHFHKSFCIAYNLPKFCIQTDNPIFPLVFVGLHRLVGRHTSFRREPDFKTDDVAFRQMYEILKFSA